MKRTLLTYLAVSIAYFCTGQVVLTDASINTGETLTLTADEEYLLDGYVFVEDGATLNIDPGAVIKGKAVPTDGSAASALIVSRGGTINALGEADQPIIFTAEFDDLSIPNDLTKNNKGQWGGLIILGNGIVGEDGGTDNIEGIPSGEGRAEYGGSDNEESSGTLQYVSIRHGGSALEANNEINGLTLGGVGSGTVINHIEVFANLDDGIEIFGGAPDIAYAAVAFCGDDSFDYDESYSGRGQFWFVIQDELSNRAGELDGSEATDLLPKTDVTVANATFIGGGLSSTNEDGNDALRIRDAGAIKLWNSIITEFADGAIAIDNDIEGDSYDELLAGNIAFIGNLFAEFGDGDSFADIVSTDGGDDNILIDLLTDNSNTIQSIDLGGISRSADGGLDPRPNAGSPALSDVVALPEDPFLIDVDFKGAFSNTENWATGWTALDAYGYFGDLSTVATTEVPGFAQTTLFAAPNPVSDMTTISWEQTEEADLTLAIYDMTGRVVERAFAQMHYAPGAHTVSVDTDRLAVGSYRLVLSAEGTVVSQVAVIKK